jgi:hypothetical protein
MLEIQGQFSKYLLSLSMHCPALGKQRWKTGLSALKLGRDMFSSDWGLCVILLCFFSLVGMHQFRPLLLFFPGWNRRGKHWQLSFLSASLYDPLAERSCVQCHHCGSEKVKDMVFTRNMFSFKNKNKKTENLQWVRSNTSPGSQQPPTSSSLSRTVFQGPSLERDCKSQVLLRAEHCIAWLTGFD